MKTISNKEASNSALLYVQNLKIKLLEKDLEEAKGLIKEKFNELLDSSAIVNKFFKYFEPNSYSSISYSEIEKFNDIVVKPNPPINLYSDPILIVFKVTGTKIPSIRLALDSSPNGDWKNVTESYIDLNDGCTIYFACCDNYEKIAGKADLEKISAISIGGIGSCSNVDIWASWASKKII